MENKRLYGVWNNIKQRCFNPKNPSYKYYGGRGIAMCDRWLNSYNAFETWAIQNGYDEHAEIGKCTIDRINVNGNYEPNNCRWISIAEQNRNKQNSKEHKNTEVSCFARRLLKLREEKHISQVKLAKAIGVSSGMICLWETDRSAITAPNIVKLADFFGVSTDFLLGRCNDG